MPSESPNNRPRVSVVMPFYNAGGSARRSLLEVEEFLDAGAKGFEFIFVDDGSRDDTAAVLQEVASKRGDRLCLIRQPKNKGKGAAIAAGFAAAKGDLLLFLDADLAYLVEETLKVVAALDGGADLAIACRVLDESRFVMSPNFFRYLYTRHMMGRFFNFLVRMTLVPGLLDTQAGLKGFKRDAAERIFALRTLNRFSFDVEILFIAQTLRLRIDQLPISFRYFHEDSTVRFFRDTVNMILDLMKIRVQHLTGRYRPAAASVPSRKSYASGTHA